MKTINCKVNQLYNKNQFVIFCKDTENDFITFQSYESTICIIDYENKIIQFWPDYDYSKTTSKHLKLFLRDYLNFHYENKKELEKAIKDWFIKDYKVILNYDL